MKRIYNIVFSDKKEREFKRTLSSYIDGGSENFLIHENHCYVFFHFGENAKKIDSENHELKFNTLSTDMDFVKFIEEKFKINLNFINLEPIVDSIANFNDKNPNLKITNVLKLLIKENLHSLRISLLKKDFSNED